jgi:hypothetical protein
VEFLSADPGTIKPIYCHLLVIQHLQQSIGDELPLPEWQLEQFGCVILVEFEVNEDCERSSEGSV